MADKNLSIDDILNEYSGKTSSGGTKGNDTIDIDELINSVTGGKSTPSQKTEMIEDVLEIGDNSFVFDPGDVKQETSELVITAPEEEVNKEPLAFTSTIEMPLTDDESMPDEIPALRQGKKTTQGTQAIEKVMSGDAKPLAEEKTMHVDLGKKEAPAEEPKPARPEIKPMSENPSNTAMLEGLKKLKKERGTPRVTAKIPPVNRASIENIDLEIGQKVIPNTEIGLDENATEDVLNEASLALQVLASYTVAEAQIESLVTAKGYEDCVVFMGEDSCSVVVADPDGVDSTDAARIKDIVISETDYTAAQIKIMEAE